MGVAVHLSERADGHARRAHVERERRDTGVLRHARVRAGEQQPPLRVVRSAGPHLRPRDTPLVAVALGARGERGEIRAGVRLGEQLAPDVVAGADGRQPARALLGRCVRDQRRPRDGEADQVRVQVGHVEAGQLLGDGPRLRRTRAEPAVLRRPGGHGPAPVGEGAQVRTARLEVVAAGAEHGEGVTGVAGCQTRFERSAHTGAEVVARGHGAPRSS